MRDYRRARLDAKQRVMLLLRAMAAVGILAWFFYRSPIALIPLLPVGVLYAKKCEEDIARAQRLELERQFRECAGSLQTALAAGYSAENAFRESLKEMRKLYGAEADICLELEVIARGLEVNRSIEEMLASFAERSGSSAIEQFREVFAIARRRGGNLARVVESSAELIGRQIEVRAEIRTVLSGRRAEQGIMRVVPFGILLYVGMTSPGYFDCLYEDLGGRAIMTAMLAVYVAAYLMGEKIMRSIEEDV